MLDGLTRPFKELPPKHFYDSRGAELFDRICELPEYYQTRAEREILEQRAEEIAELTGASELVELGSGTAAKTRVLLDALSSAGTLERYIPLDVTESMVRSSALELVEEYPGLSVHGVIGDFERHLEHVPRAHRAAHRRLPRRNDRELPTWQPPSHVCAGSRACSATTTTCCSAPISSRTRACSRRPTTTPRASPPSSTATCCA